MDNVFDEASSDYFESQDLIHGAVRKNEQPPPHRPRIPTPPPLSPPPPSSPMPSLSPSPTAVRGASDGQVGSSSSTIVFDDGGKQADAAVDADRGEARQENADDENGERRRRWRSPNQDLIKTPPGDGTDSLTPPAPPTGSSHRPKTWAPTRKVRKRRLKNVYLSRRGKKFSPIF